MGVSPLKLGLYNVSTRLHWQLLLSAISAVTAFAYVQGAYPGSPVALLREPLTYLTMMGVVGGILALASAVGFAHVTSFVGEASRTRVDAFHRLRDRLFDFDRFLSTKPSDLPLVHEARSFSWELKRLRLEDVPITDWADRVEAVVAEVQSYKGEREFAVLPLEVLEHLGELEHCLNVIGVAGVKQILGTVVAAPLMRSFGLLAFMLLSGIAMFFTASDPRLVNVMAVVPVFFTVMAAMLFIQVAWYIHRELSEIDFLEASPPVAKNDA